MQLKMSEAMVPCIAQISLYDGIISSFSKFKELIGGAQHYFHMKLYLVTKILNLLENFANFLDR